MNSFFWSMEPQLDPKLEKRHLGRLSLAVAAIPVFSLAGQLILMLVLRLLYPNGLELPNWFSMVAGSLCMYAFAMPLSYLLFRTCRAEPAESKPLGFLSMLALISVCLALTLAGSIIGNIVNVIVSLLTGTPVTNPVEQMTANTPMWANLLFVVILAPILEELFFRKLMIDRLRRYGDLTAILVSGIVFGVIHGNFSQFFYAAMLGVVFGYVYCRTGRLWYTIFLHMFINFFGSVYALEMLKALGDLTSLETPTVEYIMEHLRGFLMMAGYYALYGIAILTCIPCAIWLVKKISLRKAPCRMPAQDWVQTVLCNPMIWVSFAVLAGNFLLNTLA